MLVVDALAYFHTIKNIIHLCKLKTESPRFLLRGGALFLALALLFTSSNLQAQCPTGWNAAISSVPVICPSGTCNAVFQYCWRLRTNWPLPGTNTYETSLTGDIVLDGNCDCPIVWELVFHDINEKLKQSAIAYAPPCDRPGYAPLKGRTQKPACYKFQEFKDDQGNVTGKGWTPCSDPAKCVELFDMCYAYGHVLTSNNIFTIEGNPQCSAPPIPWAPSNVCYLVCDAH